MITKLELRKDLNNTTASQRHTTVVRHSEKINEGLRAITKVCCHEDVYKMKSAPFSNTMTAKRVSSIRVSTALTP